MNANRMMMILVVTSALVLLGAGSNEGASSGDLEANKALVREFNDLVNSQDWAGLESVVASDFKRHSAATQGPPIRSLADFVALQKNFLQSFPDQHVELQQVFGEGDRVAVLGTYNATHTGPLGDVPPTGKSLSSPFLGIFRIEGGKIAELWIEWDNLALMAQLGFAPPLG